MKLYLIPRKDGSILKLDGEDEASFEPNGFDPVNDMHYQIDTLGMSLMELNIELQYGYVKAVVQNDGKLYPFNNIDEAARFFGSLKCHHSDFYLCREGDIHVRKIKDPYFHPSPEYKTPGAAAMDLYCGTIDTEDGCKTLRPGETAVFPTGVFMELPRGKFGMVTGRSSFAKRGILTHVGIIDSDYRGEIGVTLTNISGADVRVESGTRIAQMLILSHETAHWTTVDSLSASSRGEGGFGSTGL